MPIPQKRLTKEKTAVCAAYARKKRFLRLNPPVIRAQKVLRRRYDLFFENKFCSVEKVKQSDILFA